MVTVLVLLIGLILIVIGLIFLTSNKGTPSRLPEVSISLEELSQIWMPYNKNVEPAPTSEENIEELFEEIKEDGTVVSIPGSNIAATPVSATAINTVSSPVPQTTATPATQMENTPVSAPGEAEQTGGEGPGMDQSVATETPQQETKTQPQAGKKPQGIALPDSVGLLKEFWAKCVLPYKQEIQEQGMGPVIQELVNLIEKHGQSPSVVTDNRDTESTELVSVRDNLSQVSLKEHTYHVCMKMIDLVKETYKDYQNLMPKALVTCLAHDIGKIAALRETGAYNTYDHPLVGASKLAEIFSGHDVFWAKQAIQSVKDHHIASKDQWTALLKQADREARQTELLRFTSQYEIKPFDAWFSVDRFLKELEGYINVTQTNKWEAFSFQGLVYCKPDLLYSIAKKMCREAKVLDLMFVYESDKESVFRLVVNALRKEGLIPDMIGQGHYARRFEIKTKVGIAKSAKFMLTPIKAERFNMAEIEARKQGFLEIISAVFAV